MRNFSLRLDKLKGGRTFPRKRRKMFKKVGIPYPLRGSGYPLPFKGKWVSLTL